MTYSGDLRRPKFLKICRQVCFFYMQGCYSLGDLLELLSRKSTGVKFVNNLQVYCLDDRQGSILLEVCSAYRLEVC